MLIFQWVFSADDSVAQLVEHNTFNVGVLGSNPNGITYCVDYQLIKLSIDNKIDKMVSLYQGNHFF